MMGYIISKVFRSLYWNRWISLLLLAEIMLGMSVFVYSTNLYYAITNEEAAVKVQERDLLLQITTRDESLASNEPAVTLADYQKIQQLTDGKTFMSIAIPQFFPTADQNVEFSLILADYNQLGLAEGYSYWGEGLAGAQQAGVDPLPELPAKDLPARLNQEKWKTEMTETVLKDAVVAPLNYMEELESDIVPGLINLSWRSSELSDAETVSRKVESYLTDSHGEHYSYRIYSPEIDLKNRTYKSKLSIQTLNKAALLFLTVFFMGMMAIFNLQFEHRKEEYGISLACGAQNKQLFLEILLEILLLNGLGTLLGCLVGSVLTYRLDLGIMIGTIAVRADFRTMVLAVGLCLLITLIVVGSVFGKLKNQKIIALLKNV